MKLMEDLKWRGLVSNMTDENIEDVLEKEKLTFYVGTDPTARSLHIGHLIFIVFAKRLMDAGHKPIILVGGATGLIGDPSGRSTERQLLTLEETLKNADLIEAQVKKMLPEAKFRNNYEWIGKMDVITFLRDYGKLFGINYMLAKDSVKSRIDRGISFTEFSYQIIQAIDFHHLYKEEGCRLQIGGQDQWGNITGGFELIRKIEGDADVHALTFPLLTNTDGSKFGKSAGNAVWLDRNLTSPYEFYQYWFNTADEDVVSRLKQFTFLSHEEIDELARLVKEAPERREAQKALAKEITRFVHGEEGLAEALRMSEAFFTGDVSKLSLSEIEVAFKGQIVKFNDENLSIINLLVSSKLAQSNREAREFINSGAISVNNTKVTDLNKTFTKEEALHNRFLFIKRGKKKNVLLDLE